MLWNGTSTAWRKTDPHERKANQREKHAAQTVNSIKEKRNENQADDRVRGRPGQGLALLYGGTGLCQEGRFQQRPISLADRGLARRAGRHGAAARVEQQPRSQSVSGSDVPTGPARGHVLHRRCPGRLRKDEGSRRRLHHAAHRRDGLHHCHAERHLRQPHSACAVGTEIMGGPMIDPQQYTPGPASAAQVRKDGEKWTLILVRELRHAPEKVWQALTDPAHLREWAPFEADGNLGKVGAVKLTWVGTSQVTETKVTRAEAPKV